MTNVEINVFELVGGEKVFQKLVDNFYKRVEADPVLRPLFPDDLEPGKRWQYLFLVQFFGGSTAYLQERGHPRLRLRHSSFPIDQRARDHWLKHMYDAIDELRIVEPARAIMREYFERASTFMINADNADPNLLRPE